MTPLEDLWRLNERQAILPLEAVRGARVCADITLCAIQRLGILSASLSGVRHGTPGRAVEDDDLYLGMTRRGHSVARQGRTDVPLTAGDGVLLSAREGFTMTHVEPVQFLGVKLSRALLSDYVHNPDAAVMRPIRGSAIEWLARYLGAILIVPPGEPTPDGDAVRRLIPLHVHDVVGAAIATARGSALALDGLGVRAARLHAIRSHILEHLDSARLTVASVAAAHRITSRYVHKLFEFDGTTYSAFVLEQRLARVYRQLADPRFAGRAISALAFDAGFGDLSYFNRAFKRRYAATPSEVRNQGPSNP